MDVCKDGQCLGKGKNFQQGSLRLTNMIENLPRGERE